MWFVTALFWLSLFGILMLAAGDCLRWPRQLGVAWQRFRPVTAVVVVIALVFLAVNLHRLGASAAGELANRAVHLVALAAGASIFFCGGWHWVARAGHVGLYERIRRRLRGLETPSVARSLAETVAIAAVIVTLSALLFRLVQAAPSPAFRKLLESQQVLDVRSGYLSLLILVAPLWEETAFRWYLLNRLEEAFARRPWGRLAAIVGSSALWAGGHLGMTDPGWAKLVQIFLVGCLLAWRFREIGLSGCFVAHLAMNFMAALTLPGSVRS